MFLPRLKEIIEQSIENFYFEDLRYSVGRCIISKIFKRNTEIGNYVHVHANNNLAVSHQGSRGDGRVLERIHTNGADDFCPTTS